VTRALVLAYHAVSEEWPAALSVTPERLEQQLGLLVSRGYRGQAFSDAIRSRPDERVVAVTFDDAFRSVLTHAFPVLSRLGLPGSVFVPTDFPGRGPMSWPGVDHWLGGPYERELMPLSWDELRALADEGWEIGSHTCSHPYLSRLSGAELDRELVGSRRTIEEVLGRPCRSLAYPYGDHDEQTVRAAAAAGYQAACTLPRRFTSTAALSWPRVGVYHGDGRLSFHAKISPSVRVFRGTRAWGALDAALRAGRRRVAKVTP
jgi:peptidoglycan/xylan/chitin deacetylase (PgdA/CDA1 family)